MVRMKQIVVRRRKLLQISADCKYYIRTNDKPVSQGIYKFAIFQIFLNFDRTRKILVRVYSRVKSDRTRVPVYANDSFESEQIYVSYYCYVIN